MDVQRRTDMVLLRCTVEIDGEAVSGETMVSVRAWDAADEGQRLRFFNLARESLGREIVRRGPAVTVDDPRTRSGSGSGSGSA